MDNELDALEREKLDAALASPSLLGVRGRWQYYYKQNQCTAQTAESAGCICWHDEGSGPNKDAVHDRPYEDRWLSWRLAP